MEWSGGVVAWWGEAQGGQAHGRRARPLLKAGWEKEQVEASCERVQVVQKRFKLPLGWEKDDGEWYT